MTFELGNATFDSDSIKFNGFRLSINGALSQQEKALQRELDFRKFLKSSILLAMFLAFDFNSSSVILNYP